MDLFLGMNLIELGSKFALHQIYHLTVYIPSPLNHTFDTSHETLYVEDYQIRIKAQKLQMISNLLFVMIMFAFNWLVF